VFAPFFRSQEWSCSGHYLESPQQYRKGPVLPIVTEWCRQCGLIRQVPGNEVPLDYADIARDTARQMPDYTSDIINSLTAFGLAPDDAVMEIGANDGSFLRAVQAAGFRNLIAIEPSKSLSARAAEAGLIVHNTLFSTAFAEGARRRHGSMQAVLCRHTLEHVPDITDMVQGIAAVLAPGGLAFIEVPDTDWIVSELFAHEIWDEHITYFRAGSLAALLRRAGLVPVRLQRARFRDTRNLLCWAVRAPARVSTRPDLVDDATAAGELDSFQSRWDAVAGRLRDAVATAPRPLIAIGAAHIQMNFLNFAGLDAAVELLIDDDPVKAGHYAPLAKAVPIRSTADAIASVRAGTILRTAFPYPAWEGRICAALAPFGVGNIDPYALR
jgi:SAM-dependent methyltransferase